MKDKPHKGHLFNRFTPTNLLYQLRWPKQISVMFIPACEQVPRGPLGTGTAESPFCPPPPVPEVPQRNCSQAILLAVTALHVSGAFRDGIGQRQRWKALWGPLRQEMGEISPLVLPGSQSSPEKLLAGYVTGREDSKREWKFVLELDKQKERWRNFTCCVGWRYIM